MPMYKSLMRNYYRGKVRIELHYKMEKELNDPTDFTIERHDYYGCTVAAKIPLKHNSKQVGGIK